MCLSDPNRRLALIYDIPELLVFLLQQTLFMFLSSSRHLLFSGHKDLCNLDWPEAHCMAKTDLELVIPWPLLPVGFQTYITTTDVCDVRSRT